MKKGMSSILIGLPALTFALLIAGYFSVYRTIESVNSANALPDWQTLLFINLPNFVTANTITLLGTIVLLIVALIGLTAEAYKFGLKQTTATESTAKQIKYADVMIVASVVLIALAIFIILQSAFSGDL